MQKLKRSKFVIVAIVIFSMVAMYGYMPVAKAASMQSASILLGDSAPSATATSTLTFNLATTTLPSAGFIRVDLTTADFTGYALSRIDCNTGGVASTTGEIVDCTYAGGLDSAVHTIDIRLTNGAAGVKNAEITAYTSAKVEIESSQVAVYIVASVSVTANVAATLTFTVTGTTTGAIINGATTTAGVVTTATAIPFGTLTGGVRKTGGQDLKVSTNATGGFTVTVAQNQDLRSGAGAEIDAFIDNVPSAGAAWIAPLGTLGDPLTYGHMGLTSSDAGLAVNSFVGLTTGTPTTVMSNGGPSDGISAGIGYASVAYSVQISDLQEAGDYDSTLTYVCTPTY